MRGEIGARLPGGAERRQPRVFRASAGKGRRCFLGGGCRGEGAQGSEGGFAPGSRTYTLGSREVTYNDSIPRQVMASVFSLRNR